MPLEEGDTIMPPHKIVTKTADQINAEAAAPEAIKKGKGFANQVRTVEVGSTMGTCPICNQHTLRTDMRRKVNRIYCENANCDFDQASPQYASGMPGTGAKGVTVVSKKGVEGQEAPTQSGVKIISNRTPSL